MFREQVEAALMSAHKRGLSRAAVMWGGTGRVPEDEIDYEVMAGELVHRKGALRSIINTQRGRVGYHVAQALDKGGGAAEAEAGVREAIRLWSETQSSLIAETEAVHAFNEGTLTVAELTGSTQVYVQDGHDDDEPCKEADGSVWTIEEARERRLEHPRCRRSFIPLD